VPHEMITVSVPTIRSAWVQRVSHMFDVPLAERVERRWDVHLPLEERDWRIGLIVAPAGSGKTTMARRFWPEAYCDGYADWGEGAFIERFRSMCDFDTAASKLISVGFGSQPNWITPYGVLSKGEQMRANLARALLDARPLIVFDNFAVDLDATTARVASAALAEAMRDTADKQFIAVTTREDILEWLTPDWTYVPRALPHSGTFEWRSLQRPDITLQIERVQTSLWHLFGPYHYLSAALNDRAECYCAFWGDEPVCFVAVLQHMNYKGMKRISRIVTRPEYQGVGIGAAVLDRVCAFYVERGQRIRIIGGHPAIVQHCRRSPKWHTFAVRAQGSSPHGNMQTRSSEGRSTATFEYVG
jgi:GNAT superfamily N-acetyltransferase